MSGIFVTGTDTGVGKTYATIYLAEKFRRDGIDVGVMKPISTGPDKDNDAWLLKKKLKLDDPIELINPVRLKYPLAPYPAAKLEKKKIDLKKIFSAYKELEKRHQTIIVEGIGGVAVPITEKYCVADLIHDLGLPAVVVARAGLGTINHTLLTIGALIDCHVEVMGVIMNGFTGKDRSEKTNAEVIEKLSGVPVLEKLKWAR
ncbi:MAG: dethiobiotin synthase [Candidatus Margulisbacteria bacterium]|nr:dethiobiotin synthase [Candidatus Margulisiibacteriota bacterium]